MTTTRNMKEWSQANTCPACRKLDPPEVTLATHGVTDSVEVQPGIFEETKAQRFGCDVHRVASMVFYLNGETKPLSEVVTCQ